MAKRRSQPYRLDWQPAKSLDEMNRRLSQLFTSADEMFQILFDDLGLADTSITNLTTTVNETIVNGGGGGTGGAGKQGPPGLDGEQGEEGVQGPIGPKGLQGPSGIMGPPGMDGQDGADLELFIIKAS